MKSIIFSKPLEFIKKIFDFIAKKPPPYVFEVRTGKIQFHDRSVKLRPKSAAILEMLCHVPGRIVSKEELHKKVWHGVNVHEQSIFQCVNEIRQAFQTRDCIRTHSGQGYEWIGLNNHTPPKKFLPLYPAMALLCICLISGIIISLFAKYPASEDFSREFLGPRIAVLPAIETGETFKDRGLSLGLMQMITSQNNIGHFISPDTVLNEINRQSLSGMQLDKREIARLRDTLKADILLQVSFERDHDVLKAKFVIDGAQGKIQGEYSSHSLSWIAQKVTDEISDAVNYSLGKQGSPARVDSHNALIAAKSLVNEEHYDAAETILTDILQQVPEYLSARYYLYVSQLAQDKLLMESEISSFIDASRMEQDKLNETRAYLLAVRNAASQGNQQDVELYAERALTLATRYQYDFLEAAVNLVRGTSFAQGNDFPQAISSYERAISNYEDADCVRGLIVTYKHLASAYRATGLNQDAEAIDAKVTSWHTLLVL